MSNRNAERFALICAAVIGSVILFSSLEITGYVAKGLLCILLGKLAAENKNIYGWVMRNIFRPLRSATDAILGFLLTRAGVYTALLVIFLIVVPGRVLRASIPVDQQNQTVDRSGIRYDSQTYNGSVIRRLTVDLTQAKPEILLPPNMASGKRTLSDLVAADSRIIAAVNGDYFDEGGTLGFLTREGRRMTAPRTDRSSLCFADGEPRAYIQRFRFHEDANVTANGVKFPIRDRYNNVWKPGQVGIYTYSRRTASGYRQRPVVQSRVKIEAGQDGDVSLAGTVTEMVVNPSCDLSPKQDEMIIVASDEPNITIDAAYAWGTKNLQVGSKVSAYLPIVPKPPSTVISGGPEFLRFGQYCAQETGNEYLREQTARTAVGITEDGKKLLIVVVEGGPRMWDERPQLLFNRLCAFQWAGCLDRIESGSKTFGRWLACQSQVVTGLDSFSRGMNSQELAFYFQHQQIDGQPIMSAINLDGGGSSTMVVADIQSDPVNRLMESQEVKLANGLAFYPRPE